MKIPDGLLSNMSSEIPASIIVLVLEHIAISKSFGRINDYKVVPDQELIAIGVTNLIGTFFHSYPATGSFSRSALKAKCNVRSVFWGIHWRLRSISTLLFN
ncbi:ANL_collapsed_G0004780.mRNA.1.CDS.1 [Saccharomyces cerevisiae]|nr:ANL_collapsed_G0004780.mRNA.1.CDS.1 [Saccharomyces cerevisiae]